jgi:exopolysaccharide biosynthesis polyprenyl glycosylphosphotransferase
MTTQRKTALTLLTLDAASTIVVFNVVSYYRLAAQHFIFTPLFAPLALLVFGIYLIDGYESRTNLQSLDYTSLHIIAVISATLATLLLTFAFLPAGYELQSSRAVIALSFVVLIPVTLVYRHLIYQRIAHSRAGRSLLFFGDAAGCEAFGEECRKMGVTQPIMYTTLERSEKPGLSPARAFAERILGIRNGQYQVEAIILRESSRDLPSDAAQQLMDLHFGGTPTYTLELFHQVYWHKIPLYRINPTWLFQEGFQIAREPVFERVKRASDIALAAVGLLLAAPLLAIAGIAIWAEDRGPVFFRQNRVGRNRSKFRLVKLRTMRTGVADGPLYTQPGDLRITRVGRFLRATRVDEMPQLWNVFRGDMSLIGPRAEWDRLVEEYEQQIPCYSFRHLVKPGITGWAQVNYPYGASIEDTQRKLEYDLYYIRHFSFLLDASIVLKTVQIMLFGKGR